MFCPGFTKRLAISLVLVSGLMLAFFVGCRAGDGGEAKPRMVVAVSILPEAGFVEAVGGDKVEVVVMVPPGADPHTYEVKSDQMVKLAQARIYAKVGSPLEFELAWLDKLIGVNDKMLVVDCSRGIELMENADPDEPGNEDPHIWLSVKNAEVMVRNICDGLVQVDPANRAYYEANRNSYLEELARLDNDLAVDLAGVANRSFIVFHPAFGYFARDYGLTQIGVEQGGKEPSADYIVRLIQEAREQNIRVVFVSPEFDTKSAGVIAKEISGRVVIIDPLAKDFVSNMRAVESAVREAMQ
jgi:zinc transport system substrate-binding protein